MPRRPAKPVKPAKHPDLKELEALALSAELGRQIVHDCGNFLYNLLLQIELWERQPETKPENWSGVKREAKNLAQRLQEWQQYRSYAPTEKSKIDLNQTIQAIVKDFWPEGKALEYVPGFAPEPLWFTSIPGDTKRLCRLVLESMVGGGYANAEPTFRPLLQTEKKTEAIVFQVANVELSPWNLCWLGKEVAPHRKRMEPTLMMATCQAMAQRLDANIRAEETPERKITLAVEFPLELS